MNTSIMQARKNLNSQSPMAENILMQDQSTAKTGRNCSATHIFEPMVLIKLQQKKKAVKI